MYELFLKEKEIIFLAHAKAISSTFMHATSDWEKKKRVHLSMPWTNDMG